MEKNKNDKAKKNEKIKKETEKIKKIIIKETGIYIKKMNSRNLKKELEQFHQISAQTVFNGTFFNKFNKYTTEQFVQREEFRKLKINNSYSLK